MARVVRRKAVVILILFMFMIADIINIPAIGYYGAAVASAQEASNTIVNPGFETGDMTGWTVVEGNAFGTDSVSGDTTWWAEKIPYNQEGLYHLNGWKHNESDTGRVRSSTFTLGGTGWITFRLGGGKNTDLIHIDIVNADTKETIARFGNTEFADKNFPNVEQGMCLANMVQYKADLSAHLGENLYFEVVDNAASDWGVVFADAFFTYYPAPPATGIPAENLIKPVPVVKPMLSNGDFETGDLTGWAQEGNAFEGCVTQAALTHTGEAFKQQRKYHLYGLAGKENEQEANQRTGTLTSETIKLTSDKIDFLIGGSNDLEKVYLALVLAKDDSVLLKETGSGSEVYQRVTWDVSGFLNQDVYIKIVDNSELGHINIDDINVNLSSTIFNPDFETGDLSGWIIREGNAFSGGVSDVSTFWNPPQPFKQNGKYHMWGFQAGGDKSTGIMESSHFIMSGDKSDLYGAGRITLLVGGGNNINNVYVALIDDATGDELFRATGTNNEAYTKITWDASKYIGKELFFRVVDNATGGFGHINLDNIKTDLKPFEIENPDFEKGDLSGWGVTGSAFAISTEANGQNGTYHATGTANPAGTGTLTSGTFELGASGTIEFLLCGGNNPDNLYIALMDAKDDTELMRTASNGNTAYELVKMDASQYIGRNVYLKVVDNAADGYIGIDNVKVYIAPTYVDNPNPKGIVAWWSFDETSGNTARDKVGMIDDTVNYVFTDARYKAPSDPQWKNCGIENGALLFDGYSTYIERSSGKFVSLSNAFSIEAWVAPRNYEYGDGNKLSAIVSQYNRDTNEGFILGMYRHGTWSLQMGIDGNWYEAWVIDKPLEKYKWSYVTATFDRETSQIKLYLNGQEVACKATPKDFPMTPTNKNLLIGLNSEAVELAGIFHYNMFPGLMDEVKIYDKALSSSDIQTAYQESLEKHGGIIPAIPNKDIDEDPSVFAGDQHRPQYHGIPPANWMNECHAPIYYNGMYHLFYQHNTQGPYWHQIQWGHWVSTDMVHWKNVRPALSPEAGTLDPDGCWSGSAAYDANGNPVIFYTAGNDSASPNQRTAIATPADLNDPNLEKWIKYPTPVTEQNGNGIYQEFRDPYVWYDKEAGKWYQLVASGMPGGSSGTAFVYVSSDMINWDFKGPLYLSDRSKYPELGTVWELPVLLPLGKDSHGNMKHIFMINPHEKLEHTGATKFSRDVEVYYWIGTWDSDNCRFIPDNEEPQKMDVGDGYLTAESGFVTPDGRSVVFSMIQNVRTPQAEYLAGWAHNLALPVEQSLDKNDELAIKPIQELKSLRGKQIADIQNKDLKKTNEELKNVKGDTLEIVMEIDPKQASRFGLKVRCSENGQEETLLYYDKTNQTFNVDRTKSSVDPDVRCDGIQGGYVDLQGENLKLHVFLDRSTVEAFANYKKKLTTRVYVGRYDSLGLKAWADGDILVKSMEVWEMNDLNGEKPKPVYVPDNWDNTVYKNITNLPNHDFATGDLTGWIAEGQAFQNAMVTNTQFFWGDIYFNPSHKIPGGYHLWGFNEALGGDSLTGTLKSQTFKLGGNGHIDFLVSGGRDIDKLYVALVRASDNKELMKVTATNYEEYQRIKWDASPYIGQELYIKVVDNSTGGFGHINVDDFHVPVRVDNNSNGHNSDDSGNKTGSDYRTGVSIGGIEHSIELQNIAGNAVVKLGELAHKVFAGKENNVLTIQSIPGVNSYTLEMPAASIDSTGSALLINTALGSINIPSGMLSHMSGLDGKTAEITVANGDKTRLPGNIKAAIGDKPIIKLTLSIDGKQTNWSNPSEPVTVSIPYKPTAKELADTDSIVVWYIDGAGRVVSIPNGHYDSATGTVTFSTTHFSDYAVAYNPMGFKDVAPGIWYSKAARFIAARGITGGTGNGNYSPEARLTRGECIVMIMKAYSIVPDENLTNNFADAGNTYYSGYLAAAKRLGISAGIGNNLFAPDKKITRQEMFALLYNTLKIMGRFPRGSSGKTLSDFADAGQIYSWAKEGIKLFVENGIITGNSGKLAPCGTATRAEIAQVLYNSLKK